MASTAVKSNPASVKLLGGSVPAFTPANASRVTIDTYTKQPARPATAAPAARPSAAPAAQSASAASKGSSSEIGNLAGTAYAGALGVGAGAGAIFMGKGMMSMVEQMGPLTFKNVAEQSLGVGGALMGLPFSLVQDSFGYKSGNISAKRYWGNVVGDSLGWGAWMGGAMVVGGLLGGVGFLPVTAGLVAGTLLNDLSDHTLGRWASNFVAEHIPAAIAKSAANGVVRYVTNPIDKYLLQPIKKHLGVFVAAGGAAALFMGIKTGEGKMALKGAGAMGLSAVPSLFGLDKLFAKELPMTPVKGVDLTPGKNQAFSPADGTVSKKS